MSVVSLLGVKVLNNPAKFTDTYHFEITFECLEQLQKGTTDIVFMAYQSADANQTLSGSLPMLAPLPRKKRLPHMPDVSS